MAITWKQIDTNHNGYVDGNEAQEAKKKGVKNVWKHMTEDDYNNITRDSKLNSIYNADMDGIVTHNKGITVNLNHVKGAEDFISKRDYQQYLKDESILRYNCAKELLQKQLELKETEFNKKYGILNSVKNFLSAYGICDKQTDYLSLKNEIDNLKQKIENLKNELEIHIKAPLWRFE